MNRDSITAGYRHIQTRFAGILESVDGGSFRIEKWERPGGGGGESWTLNGDGPIERAAVNVSQVHGETPAQMSTPLAGETFFASGVSIIVHPSNPHAPTFHSNLRYFESGDARWFGGGADLTPHYFYEPDAVQFHRVLATTCGRHEVGHYGEWKVTCDDYFHLPHRHEARGIGGIFFDHLDSDLDEVWSLQQDLGESIVTAYQPILERRMTAPFGDPQRRWQELRRGRYVEFNLVWDRGTRFGLETGGRTASVLSSLPPRARWDESFIPTPGSPEADLLALVTGTPRHWI